MRVHGSRDDNYELKIRLSMIKALKYLRAHGYDVNKKIILDDYDGYWAHTIGIGECLSIIDSNADYTLSELNYDDAEEYGYNIHCSCEEMTYESTMFLNTTPLVEYLSILKKVNDKVMVDDKLYSLVDSLDDCNLEFGNNRTECFITKNFKGICVLFGENILDIDTFITCVLKIHKYCVEQLIKYHNGEDIYVKCETIELKKKYEKLKKQGRFINSDGYRKVVEFYNVSKKMYGN